MKFKLDCSKKHIPYLTKKLTQAGFKIDSNGSLMIIDNPILSFKNTDPFENFKSIVFIESFGNEILVYQSNCSEPNTVTEKLYTLEEEYKDQGFIRVNKSQIVNIRFIKEVEPCIGQKYLLTMSNGKMIDVNRSYYKNFKQYLKL